MTDTLTVLQRAREVLHERGWSFCFSSGPGTPLNLRSAVGVACSELTDGGSEWYRAYIAAVDHISKHLQEGILAWEFGTKSKPPRRRTGPEVMAMLTELINRLENDAVSNEVHGGRRSGGGSTAV